MQNSTIFTKRNILEASISVLIFVLVVFVIWRGQAASSDPIQMFTAHFPNLYSESMALTLFVPLAIAFLIDCVVSGWKNSAIYRLLFFRTTSVWTDIFSFILFSYLRIGFIALHVITYSVISLAGSSLGGVAKLSILDHISDPIAQIVVAFLVRDFFVYWTHRLQHRVSFLWEAHTMHHSANEFNVISVHRLYPLEELFGSFVSGVWLAILGASPQTYLAVIIFWQIQQHIIHSNVHWNLGWLGRWLIVSPAHHRIHHGKEAEFHDTNFGTQLIIWDRLFGTYKPSSTKFVEIGLDDKVYNRSFLWDLATSSLKSVVKFFVSLGLAVQLTAAGCKWSVETYRNIMIGEKRG